MPARARTRPLFFHETGPGPSHSQAFVVRCVLEIQTHLGNRRQICPDRLF